MMPWSGQIEVIDDVTAAVLARLTPAQKWEMASRMVIEAREMLTTIVRSQHATWSDSEIAAEVRRRMFDSRQDASGAC